MAEASRQHAFQAPTGTRDFYPADLNRLRYIQDAWRRTSINHGFDEIDGPTFEHLDLYTAKSGEGIVSELFSFERFGGEKTFALRPEFTPTLARLYAAKAASLPKPTKWFWQQNCFRAERPQRGRLREFSQWNCDIIGDDSPDADAEVIACAVGMFESLGLTHQHLRVRVNDRRVVGDLLRHAGLREDRAEVGLALLDRRTKIDAPTLTKQAAELGLDMASFDRAAAGAHESPTAQALMERLGRVGLREWVAWDLSIVRGLAYYTGMVFEVHEATGAERAIAGGGRYDKLIEMFGGPPTPAVGFGMGDVVLSLVLQDKGLMPTDEQMTATLGLRPDAFVVASSEELDTLIPKVLADLRRAGPDAPGLHARRSYKTTRNVGKLIQDAVKSRARFCIIIESATHAQLKNLDTQAQSQVPIADLAAAIRAAN